MNIATPPAAEAATEAQIAHVEDMDRRVTALTAGLDAIVTGLTPDDALDVLAYAMTRSLAKRSATKRGRVALQTNLIQRMGTALDLIEQEAAAGMAHVLRSAEAAGQA